MSGATATAAVPATPATPACWPTATGAAAATLLSMLILWYFFLPPDGLVLPTLREAGHLVVFLGVAVFVCRIIIRQRQANAELMQEIAALRAMLAAMASRPSDGSGGPRNGANARLASELDLIAGRQYGFRIEGAVTAWPSCDRQGSGRE